MTRPQMFTGDIESSDSEREENDRVTSKRVGSKIRSSPNTSSRRIRKTPRGSGRSWRTGFLKWDVLHADNDNEALLETEDRTINGPLAYRSTPQKNVRSSKGELSLSDPDSWVWREKKDAKFAVAIDATKSTLPYVSERRELVSKRGVLNNEGTYIEPEKPKEKLWLDRVESTYHLYSSRL